MKSRSKAIQNMMADREDVRREGFDADPMPGSTIQPVPRGFALTKKDFELIAKVISKCELSKTQKSWVAYDLATAFGKVYPKFNKETFMEACNESQQQQKEDP